MMAVLEIAKQQFSEWWESLAYRIAHRVERVKLPSGWHWRNTHRLTGKVIYTEIPPIARVGVTFTDEQIQTIKELVAAGRVSEVQRIILETIEKE